MFAQRYFANRYCAPRYFAKVGDSVPLTLDDLCTVFVPHLENTLYDANPNDDLNTLLAADIPTMRADVNSLEEDINTDYAIYLS